MHPDLDSLLPPGPSRRNRHPIALLGGFTAWGRNEAFGFKYWGGPGRDIQEDLRSRGFETLTLPVGPFASNWDRACEAYAILRGGRVDYGQVHAKRHGHARYGRSYPGLLEPWGEPGGACRVHLVAHSQGGQTARVLAQLLVHGSAEERAATVPEALNPLFRGGSDGILSLTTLATPHEGTSLTLKREGLVGPAQKVLALLTSLDRERPVYDFKLDPWGIRRDPDDSFADHARRVFRGPLWRGTRDFSIWDLSPAGARELNGWVRVQPGIYHFSWSTAKTREDAHGCHVPLPRMTPLWIPGSRFMGRTLRIEEGQVAIDARWFRNDGVVNTCSMAGPSTDRIRPYDGAPRMGLWNHMGILDGWDHSEILGIGREHGDEVCDFFHRWAAFLGGLEG